MPAGDYRTPKYSGGRSSGGSSSFYDDEGRGSSKSIWEKFLVDYTASSFAETWLFSIDELYCYNLIKYSTMRYSLEDILDWSPDHDSRAKRLILEHAKAEVWVKWHAFVHEGYKKHKENLAIIQAESNKKWELESQRREAIRIELLQEQTTSMLNERELTAGAISTDLTAAWQLQETSDVAQGDWIEDAVSAGYYGLGFGEEIRQRAGITLQITLSLDCSNSMYYNRIAEPAKKAFRNVGLALKKMQADADEQYPGSLYTKFFKFSLYDTGKGVEELRDSGKPLGEFENFRDYISKDGASAGSYGSMFSGEDTYLSSLLSSLENWENRHSDPGAVRLDLVITDAVLEHKDDIREASIIQERRDGNLQTVLLNFLPESEWLGSTLPRRCVQYHVDENNVDGMLRNVLHEFLAAYL